MKLLHPQDCPLQPPDPQIPSMAPHPPLKASASRVHAPRPGPPPSQVPRPRSLEPFCCSRKRRASVTISRSASCCSDPATSTGALGPVQGCGWRFGDGRVQKRLGISRGSWSPDEGSGILGRAGHPWGVLRFYIGPRGPRASPVRPSWVILRVPGRVWVLRGPRHPAQD